MLKWYGASDVSAALLGEIVVEILDKQICILLSVVIIRLLRRIGKEKLRTSVGKRGVAGVLFLGVLFSVLWSEPLYVRGEENAKISGYNRRIFNNQNGLMSSDANVIAETADGYIWIGSYAGLTRYDGTEFEFIREGGITNVTAMLSDSKGRLWIGTNDSGIACYENEKFSFYKTDDGLPADSVRNLCEGGNGEIYVATTDRICVFDTNGDIRVLNEEVFYAQSMVMYQNMLICVGNDGCVYAVRDGKVAAVYKKPDAVFFNCIGATSMGLVGGTASKEFYILEVEGDHITLDKKMPLPLQNLHYIGENQKGQIWICGDNGFGYYEKGTFHSWDVPGFSSSIECVHEDYQGNIWVASTRYGVLCLSQTPFANLFTDGGIESAVCNAVISYDGGYYVGTDNGLLFVDKEGKSVSNKLTKMLEGDRVRSLMTDSSGDLWICTYGDYGLLRLNRQGEIKSYTSAKYPRIPSDRARCITQMSDGSIAVGTADGIFFIEKGEVTGVITQADGLINSQILSLTEGRDGTLYAGSDGAGLFMIRNQKITGKYTTKDGLSSDVILRVVSSAYGELLVTSNSLCILSDKITVLTEFPYYNNFDILLEEETAYVLSSAGIFVTDLSELCANKEISCTLYDAKHGLQNALTANSWNFIGEEGDLYLCCNDGVVKCRVTGRENHSYRYGMKSAVCDGKKIALKDNKGVIPSTAKEVILNASLRNYALTDVKVRFFVEGVGEKPDVISCEELSELRIINPASGEYTARFQIFDDSGREMLEEQVYTLTKEKQMWEKGWYKAYLIFMTLEIICYVIWTFVMILDDRRKNKLLAELRGREQRELVLSQTVLALAKTVDAKDNYTSGHSGRVGEYARMIAARMGKSEEEQAKIYRAGLLHDVGKIRVPEDVINKPGKLTEEEFALIKLHPITGYHILKEISADITLSDGARFHHERYDGAGYPNGLSGEQIPEIARIIGVADAYDAMASNRSYRRALPQTVVREEIEKGKGTQFDPAIADIMLQIIDEDKEYCMKELDKSRKKILVVDDDSDHIRLVQSALEDIEAYAVAGAESGMAAIEMLKKEVFDVALLDVKLPDLDGYEMAEKIREFSDIQLVFVIDDKFSPDMEDMKKKNIADFMTKPFKPAVLKEILHAVLSE